MRIYLGTTEICGIMMKLHEAFNNMNVQNEYVCYGNHPLKEEFPDKYYNDRLKYYFKIVKKVRNALESGEILKARILQIIEIPFVLINFVDSIIKYDVFIYIFGLGQFNWNFYLKRIAELEFFLLRFFGKKVLMIFVGSDSRPPWCGKFDKSLSELHKETKRIAKAVRIAEKYCVVIDNPACPYFHSKPYISYYVIGNIVNRDEIRKMKIDSKICSESVVILHAPSNPYIKGTSKIRELIESLRLDGYQIEYIELSGRPHEEILQALAKADIVVDELYSDFPMGMLGAEAAINGVPVVSCGYFAKKCKKVLSKDIIPPVVYCEIPQLKRELVKLITNPKLRKEIGRAAREYVKNNWLDEKVANRLIKVAKGEIEQSWKYDPRKSDYLWGAACEKIEVKKRVSYLIEKYGIEGLCLPTSSRLRLEYQKLQEGLNDEKIY